MMSLKKLMTYKPVLPENASLINIKDQMKKIKKVLCGLVKSNCVFLGANTNDDNFRTSSVSKPYYRIQFPQEGDTALVQH